MSLRVWLPLNGTLDNRGLDNYIIEMVRGSEIYNTSGKIGKCFYSNGVNTIKIKNIIPDFYQYNEYSLSAWCYIEKQNTSHSGSAIISAGNWNQQVINLAVSDWSSDHYTKLRISGKNWNYTYSYNFYLNTWYHIIVECNQNNTLAYVDGVLIGNTSEKFLPTNIQGNDIYIGGATYYSGMQFFGKINDVRIYDHALSLFEVKQISQGLVLHYPLNRNGWGNENILLNTHFDKQYVQSTGWDTTKNGTQLANSWGGYNSGVNNQTTVYHAHLKKFNEEWVYEFIKTTNENWLGISQGGLQTKITPGNIYTFSWEQYCESGNNYNHGGLYYYKTGASSANFHLGSFTGNTNRKIGQWQKYSYTFTAPTDGDYNKNMSWYIYGMNGGNGVLYTRHLKLEEGDKATPWCPNSSDELYNTLGLNDNIQYDTSGYENNGTKVGTFSYDSNTPKYNVSTVFNGTDNAIQTPSLPSMISDKNYTIAVWIYKTVIGSKNYQTIYGGPSGFEIEARNGGANETKFVPWNWGKPMASYELNEWNHCVFVHSDSDCKIYLNGEYIATGTAKASNPSGNYFVGAWNTATQQNFDGLMSDFRIYATALSADDIKSLYNNSAYIDNQGNIYGAVYEEV